MFVFSLLAVFLTLLFFRTTRRNEFCFRAHRRVDREHRRSILPFGIDNLTVPLSSAIVLVVLSGVIGK